jgi:glutathione peroxidase
MDVYGFEVVSIDGQAQTLEPYRGRVLLIVNVATRCVFTPQYAAPEALYRLHKDRGLTVLGFPCDQFGHQEPGDEAAIKGFCSLTYGVSFPMFAKVEVNGPGAHPLYKHLRAAKRGWLWTVSIKWNFTKFLVNREGQVVKRFAPTAKPAAIENDLLELLG